MTTAQARAEGFWREFIALGKKEREAFLERLVSDPALREDLLDAALLEERKGEPSRPLEEVLATPRRQVTERRK